MLKAMKEQLISLAKGDDQQFHEALRARVGKRATLVLEEHLKQVIVLMPDLVNRVYFYWNRSRTQSETKKLGGYLLAYLYHPEDFLSAKKWGLFGYLDDAYFVAKIYTKVISEEMAAGRKVAAVDLGYYKEALYLKRYVRGVIPKETEKIDSMIQGILENNNQGYWEVFGSFQTVS